MRFRFLPLLIALISTSPAYAGAWLQPEDQGQFIGQATYFTSNHFYNESGDRQSQPRFNKYELQPYVEYGLTDRWTIGGTAYAQEDTQSDHDKYGIADPEIFARTALWKSGSQILSIQPGLKFESLYRNDTAPRGGSRSTDAGLDLLYGRNLHVISDHDYLDLGLGYRLRGSSLNDQWLGHAALGLQIADRWQLIPAIRAVESTGIKSSMAYSENGDMDYDLLKAECALAYHITDAREVHVNLFDHLAGKQTGDGFGATIGFAQNF